MSPKCSLKISAWASLYNILVGWEDKPNDFFKKINMRQPFNVPSINTSIIFLKII